MNNKIISLTLGITLLSTIFMGGVSEGCNLINKEKPQIQIYPEPLTYERKVISDINDTLVLPTGRYELRECDLSKLDLTNTNLNKFVFDSGTKWTKKFPKDFDLKKIEKYGENPGLDIKQLHKKGITGKGVNVGIIDGRLLVNHNEFKKNIVLYEEVEGLKGPAHYHGTPITSILCGKNVGVAPETNVFYIANSDESTETEQFYINLIKAIERMIEINKSLPEKNKIKILSISAGWSSEFMDTKPIEEAVNKAKAEGIFVMTACIDETYKFYFGGASRHPMSDPDDLMSYGTRGIDSINDGQNILIAPMDSRWIASATGKKEYVMYSHGALSMVIPYISGVYALACQVNPQIKAEEFWELALSTGDTMSNKDLDKKLQDKNIRLINPNKLIEAVEAMK